MKITAQSYRVLCKVFEHEEWVHVRTKGDHLVYTKKGYLRPVVIPKYKEVPEFIIKNNLRTAGISNEKYLEILNKI